MNDHTQGGGVQDVTQIQFKVLLPNGCQGQGAKKNLGQRANKNLKPKRIKTFDNKLLLNGASSDKSEETNQQGLERAIQNRLVCFN